MNSKDDNSDLESVDTDFEEPTARNLVDMVLKSDAKMYRKFLPEIRKLDSVSFKNMFYGNKNYDYKIKNRLNFNLLLDKFDNFKCLLEEWYEDKDTYDYIKELWEKYISIEILKDKTEKEIEDFLIGKKIQYTSWPQKIKDQFLIIIQNTKKTLIFACKKSYEKLPNKIKILLDKLYSVSKYYQKEGKELLSKLTNNQIFIIAKKYLNIDVENLAILLIPIMEMISDYHNKALNFLLETGCNIIDFFNKDFSDLKENVDGQFIASVLYSAASVYNLYKSYKNYQMTKAQLEKIKLYEDKINEIEKQFEEHKKIIEDLPEKNIQDINVLNLELDNCVKLIREDKEKIVKLIIEIKECLKEKIRQKNSLAMDMVVSGFKIGIGLFGAFLTKGFSCTLNSIGAAANGVSMVFDGVNIKNLIDMVEILEKALEKAKNVEKKIDDELEKLKQRLNENKDAAPTFR